MKPELIFALAWFACGLLSAWWMMYMDYREEGQIGIALDDLLLVGVVMMFGGLALIILIFYLLKTYWAVPFITFKKKGPEDCPTRCYSCRNHFPLKDLYPNGIQLLCSDCHYDPSEEQKTP